MGLRLFTQSMTDFECHSSSAPKRNRKHKAVTPRLGDIPTRPGTRKAEIGWLLDCAKEPFFWSGFILGGEGSQGRLLGCFTATEKQTRSRNNFNSPPKQKLQLWGSRNGFPGKGTSTETGGPTQWKVEWTPKSCSLT